jgi:uncharacterized protein (TIGR03435 family)
MKRIGMCIALVVILSSIARGQSTDKPVTFDVADVHVSAPSVFPQMSGGVLRAGRYEIRNATMVDLIKTAYGIDTEAVMGGPSWLATDRFDVIAKTPNGATPETAKVMLQNLLADRFKLTIHNDSRPLPVYVLTVGKNGSKLKPPSGKTGCQPHPQGPPSPGVIPLQVVSCYGLNSAQIGENLRMMAGGYVDHLVIDQTKLEGAWDFDIKWTPRAALQAAGSVLGLKLDKQTLTIPVLVVDHVDEKPKD